MSQHTSSMISNGVNPNSELKYQKALKQISKLINTNKILKNQCDQRQQTLGAQLSDIAMRYDQLSKKYDQLEQQKIRMEQFIDQLQQTNADMRKQSQTMARQVGYLNDVLNEQNVQLKKLSAYKQQKGISQLFHSYQQSQGNYKREIIRLQQHIISLKNTIYTLQSDITQQKCLRDRFQQQYNIVSQQVTKYRELNTHLMNKHEQLLTGTTKDKNFIKHKELESFGIQFKRQLDGLRQVKFQAQDQDKNYFAKNYELLMQEKNQYVIQLAKIKDQLEIATNQVHSLYEVEEKMANALARGQVLNQQNNMLKNRITILQSKQLMQTLGFSIDCQFPQFQQKLHKMISSSDPLLSIKNSQPSIHFTTMKSYITTLQYKLSTVIEQKRIIQKKYKSLKEKFMKKAEECFVLEDANKLIKGKLEGYERIAEKLNFQLDRSVMAHQDQIVKMVAITNNLVDKKVQQSKKSMAFVKTQFDMEIQKAQRTQKTLTQQVQSLKLQQSALIIKISDLQQKLHQSQQFNKIYQTKLCQVKESYSLLQSKNTQLSQTMNRLQLLYNCQKLQHQTILLQRQSLTTKSNKLSQELTENRYKWEDEIKKNQERFNNQLRRIRNQNNKFREQLQVLNKLNYKLTIEIDQRRGKEHHSVNSFQLQNQYYTQLQHNYHQLKNANRALQTQLITNKTKISAFDQIQKQLSVVQAQIMKKKDQLNDQKRSSLLLKRELQTTLQSNKQLTQQNALLSQQLSMLRSKPQKQSWSPSTKQLQSRRQIHHLSQQISILQSFIRDQKRNTFRVLNQLNLLKDENQQLRNTINRNKHNQEQINHLIREKDNQIQKIKEDLSGEKVRNQAKETNIANLNNLLAQAENQFQAYNQELSNTKAKLTKTQVKINQITRQLAQLKYYIMEADKMLIRLSSLQKLDWNQQRQKDNLTSLIQHLNRIIKANQTQLSNDSGNQYNFVPSSSFGNFQSKSPMKILQNGYQQTNDSFNYPVSSSNYDISTNRFSKSSTSNEHISIKGY